MRVTIACLSENDPDWMRRVENLALSRAMVGGAIGEARFVAYFVNGLEPRAAASLARLGVEVRAVEPIGIGGRHANKLRMLDLTDQGCDMLLALDCDVIFTGDPVPFLRKDALGLKPADESGLSHRDWRTLYRAAGLGNPEPVMRASLTGEAIPPYFNSGVIAVPNVLLESLREEWMASHAWLVEALERDPHLLPTNVHWFADQISLALAVKRAKLPYSPLPLEMNFPTHVKTPPRAREQIQPRILHYHRDIDAAGFLTRPRNPIAASQVDAFNSFRAERLGRSYTGLRPRPRRDRLRLRVRRLRALFSHRHRIRSRIRDLRASVGVAQSPPPLSGPRSVR
jgi:hypothetical protein